MFALDVNPMVIDKWHQEPWPQVTFGSLRLWDAHSAWREINTANGVYDWSGLDAWLGAAQTGGQHVLYTFAQPGNPAAAHLISALSAACPIKGSVLPQMYL
jgi:hypothetical protein